MSIVHKVSKPQTYITSFDVNGLRGQKRKLVEFEEGTKSHDGQGPAYELLRELSSMGIYRLPKDFNLKDWFHSYSCEAFALQKVVEDLLERLTEKTHVYLAKISPSVWTLQNRNLLSELHAQIIEDTLLT